MVGGVGEGREEAGVGDECFVFVVWHDGESGLGGISMSEMGLSSEQELTKAKRWWKWL